MHAMASEYDIKGIYQKQDLPSDSKAICSFGKIEDASAILVPVKLDTGKYVVRITRKESNLYHIEGTDYYIETSFCSEMAYNEEIILVIEWGVYKSRGKIIFD